MRFRGKRSSPRICRRRCWPSASASPFDGWAAQMWLVGFLAGWLLDRFGRKSTMVPGFLGVTIMMLLLLAVTAALHLSLVWYVATFLAGVAAQSLRRASTRFC